MWSNISAPKSGLVAAKVGHQAKQQKCKGQPPKQAFCARQENNSNSNNHEFAQTSPKAQNPIKQQTNGSPLMRYKHAVCSSPAGFIYIHGGRFGNGVPLDDDVWRFDPHENSWVQLATRGCKPPSLQEHTLVEHRERLYLFGGQVSAASGQENFFWRLDLAANEWTSLDRLRTSMKFGAYLGPTNRRGHSACLYKDSIYIFGGYEDFLGSSNQLWQYDLLNERWELRNLSSSSACHPEPRHNHSAVVFEDSMYIYGGLSNLKPLSDLWRWSWKEKRWFKERTRGQAPGQLHGHTAIQAFGSMFVFGGERQTTGRTTRSLWRLNLANLCWQKIKPKGPRPNPTTWHAAVANPLGILDGANYFIEGEHSDELEFEAADVPAAANAVAAAVNTAVAQQALPSESVRPVTSETQEQLQQRQQQQLLQQLRPNVRLAGKRASNQENEDVDMDELELACGDNVDSVAAGTQSNGRSILESLDSDIKEMFLQAMSPESAAEALARLGSRDELCTTSVRNSATQSQLSSFLVPHSNTTQTYQTARENLTVSQSTLTLMPTPERLHSVSGGVVQRRQPCTAGPSSVTKLSEVKQRRSMHQFNGVASLRRVFEAGGGGQSKDNTQRCERNEQQRQVRKGRPKSEIVQSLIDRADARIKGMYTPYFNRELGREKTLQQLATNRQRVKLPKYDPNDPILGELANQTVSAGREIGGRPRAAGPSLATKSSRHSTPLDKSKRHTIHQTMTYYNLYFAEDKRSQDSSNSPPSVEAIERPKRHSTHHYLQGQHQKPDWLACNSSNNSNSLSAALVGVHEATCSSSGAGDLSQRTLGAGSGRLESELGSLMHSSDSQTLCGNEDIGDEPADGDRLVAHERGQTGPASSASSQASSSSAQGNQLMRDRGDDLFGRVGLERDLQQRHNEDEDQEEEDNTSLSFSVIAEFEEDDMLQYSSPIDLNATQRRNQQHIGLQQTPDERRPEEHDEDSRLQYGNSEDEGQRCASNLFGEEDERLREEEGQLPSERLAGAKVEMKMLAQKSTSSGYDSLRSIQSSSNGLQPADKSAGEASKAPLHNGFSTTSSSMQTSLLLSPECKRAPQISIKREPGATETARQQPTVATRPPGASTTAESLALTADTASECGDSSRGRSLLMSPQSPGQSQTRLDVLSSESSGSELWPARSEQCPGQTRPKSIGRRSSSFASSLISGPSRLFGKKRVKTRYWQLCMFVIGGKQQGGHHNASNQSSEPITMWRLYI